MEDEENYKHFTKRLLSIAVDQMSLDEMAELLKSALEIIDRREADAL